MLTYPRASCPVLSGELEAWRQLRTQSYGPLTSPPPYPGPVSGTFCPCSHLTWSPGLATLPAPRLTPMPGCCPCYQELTGGSAAGTSWSSDTSSWGARDTGVWPPSWCGGGRGEAGRATGEDQLEHSLQDHGPSSHEGLPGSVTHRKPGSRWTSFPHLTPSWAGRS